MARVYLVKYNGQNIWIPESGDCEDGDAAAAKVTGCKPGYNCFVSTRFTGNLTPQEYIAQQQAAETAPSPTPSPTPSPAPAPTTPPPAPSPAPTTTTTLPQPTLQQMTDNATGWSGTFGVPGYVGGFVGVTPGTPQAEWDEYTRYVAAQEQYPNVLPPAPNINEYENIRAQFTGGGTPSGGTPSGGTPSGGTPSGGDEGFDYRQWALDFYKGHLGAGQEAAEREHYESPMYYPAFTDWVREQGDMSGAFRGFVEQKYPSLAAQHQYDVGHLTGFPSEEEALAGAQGIEQAFQGWLTEETPALYQEYMGQRPYARGERYADYSPTTRLTNW